MAKTMVSCKRGLSKSHCHRNWNFLDFGLHFGCYLVGESHTKVDMWLILGSRQGKWGSLLAGRLAAGCLADHRGPRS